MPSYDKLNYDVIVIGGGPAGTVAAVAAARAGAKVLLVEQHGFLGGMLTAAGTGPMMSFHAGKTQVVKGIPQEIVARLQQAGFSPGHMEDFAGYTASVTPFSAEGLKLILEQLCRQAGVTILYHTTFVDCTMQGDRIAGVRLFAKNGFFTAKAKVFIDASADADLSVSAGVETVYGRESDGLAQPMSLNLLVGNVDREKVLNYVLEQKDDMLSTVPFERLRRIPRSGIQGGYELLRRARSQGGTKIENDHLLCFETNTPGQYIINMTHIAKRSAIDAFDLTDAEMEGRRQAWETFDFFVRYVPGFANAQLIQTGPNIGVRESRKIKGVYTLQADDLLNNVMFPDAVAMGGYPIDVHAPGGYGEHSVDRHMKPGSWYSIPYRCLITEKVPNLLVAGRCISATQQACGAVRVTPILMAISQACGSAAALACTCGVAVQAVSTLRLQQVLRMDGAFLQPYAPSL